MQPLTLKSIHQNSSDSVLYRILNKYFGRLPSIENFVMDLMDTMDTATLMLHIMSILSITDSSTHGKLLQPRADFRR